jgi:CRISPR-associated protein Csm4
VKIIRLQPRGDYRTELTSDTLFGIICWGISVLYGSEILEDLLERFVSGEPPFLISSAFPYTRVDGKIEYFFPRPILPPITGKLSGENLDNFKRYKKIKWLRYSIFRKFQTGEITENDFFQSKEWKDCISPSIISEIQMHNTIHRLTAHTAEGNLYYTPVYTIQNGGLYFFIREIEEGVLDYILSAFRLFSHLGIGGDASIGKGTFVPELADVPFDFSVQNPNSRVILSYYYPTPAEAVYYKEHADLTWYRLIHRKGKMGGILYPTGNTWKKGIHVFDVGSIFPVFDQKKIIGGFPIVKESSDKTEFPVYFYGYPLVLDFKLQES